MPFISISNPQYDNKRFFIIIVLLDIENGGMSMVNLDSYIDSRRIQCIYRIINEPIENWNAM
jgi:hypothetical protein